MKQITSLTGHKGAKDNNGNVILNPMQRNMSRNDSRRGIRVPDEISEDLAYLCGIFAGDGSINYRRNKNEYSLKVVGNPKDEKEFYHQVIGPKFKNIFGVFPRMKYHDTGETYGFSVYSKTIYNYLVNVIGLPSGVKYSSLRIPEIFLDDERMIIAFVRGVFDTDGCICFKKGSRKQHDYPNISVASKSEEFVNKIAIYLRKTGLIFPPPYEYMQTDIRVFNGHTITYRLEINGHKNLALWMDKIGFYSPKHLEKIRMQKQYKYI